MVNNIKSFRLLLESFDFLKRLIQQANLNPIEQSILVEYVHNYSSINNYLRLGTIDTKWDLHFRDFVEYFEDKGAKTAKEAIQLMIADIDNIIAKNSLTQSLTVYRSADSKNVVNEILIEKGYCSVALHPDGAKLYNRGLFIEFQLPIGQKFAPILSEWYAPYNPNLSKTHYNNQNEDTELLLPRNTHIRLLGNGQGELVI